MTTVQGHVSAILLIENRIDLIEIHVNTHTAIGSGKYVCDPAKVTFGGNTTIVGSSEAQIRYIGAIVQWFVAHRVWAIVTNTDTMQEGTGNIPCESVTLTSVE